MIVPPLIAIKIKINFSLSNTFSILNESASFIHLLFVDI